MTTAQLNQQADSAPGYCNLVGVEVEGWSLTQETCEGLKSVEGAKWTTDAGLNLLEIVTTPHESVKSAFDTVRQIDQKNKGMIYTPSRPPEVKGNQGVWQSNPRYEALRQALEREAPGNSDRVQRMTEEAAIHINFSGNTHPHEISEDIIFLFNVFNNITPYIAAKVHDEMGFGKGHLSIWQKFGLRQRFPDPGRWFRLAKEMIMYIESVPTLFKVTEGGEFDIYPGIKQSVKNALDLTFMWWFLRLKLSPEGTYYMEARYLPSMPIDAGEYYAQQMLDIVDVLMYWFHNKNMGQPVTTPSAATPAFRYMLNHLGYTPSTPLSKEEWLYFFNR